MPLKGPSPFNFHCPAEWPSWKQNYLRYFEADEIEKKSDSAQVSNFIYHMGPEADKILAQFQMPEADKKKINPVLAKFDEYFVPKRNIIHERAQFHKCSQKETESVDEYVRRLYDGWLVVECLMSLFNTPL